MEEDEGDRSHHVQRKEFQKRVEQEIEQIYDDSYQQRDKGKEKSDEELENSQPPQVVKKVPSKQRLKNKPNAKRDQGDNYSSDYDISESEEREAGKKHSSKVKEIGSGASSRDELMVNQKKIPPFQMEKDFDNDSLSGPKDAMRDFADDEDEDIHRKQKTHKQKFLPEVKAIEKITSDVKEQKFKIKKNQFSADDLQDLASMDQQNNLNQKKPASKPFSYEIHSESPQKEEKMIKINVSSPTHSHKDKDNDKLNNKVDHFYASDDDKQEILHQSHNSNLYQNSPDFFKHHDLHANSKDFIFHKPLLLNPTLSSTTYSVQDQSTFHKICKDSSQLDKSDSQKQSGSQGSCIQIAVTSCTENTPTLQHKQNSINNNANLHVKPQIDSSSTSSEDSSENEIGKVVALPQRSKGEGGPSSSDDSDQNSKAKQKIAHQLKLKRENSQKEGGKEPKPISSSNLQVLKNKKKKKVREDEEKAVLRKDDNREQELEQKLLDMGINQKLIINYNEIEFGKKIGEGSYGQVFLGEWQKTEVAIKQFGKKNSKFNLRVQDFISEVRVMNDLRHPNIVLYMGVCLYQSQYYMITEYLNEGSLFDHLHRHKTNFQEENIIAMIEDMAKGMAYLHGRKVMHCDLKSSNVLIDESWNVKLCDFGLARIKSTLNKKKDKRKQEGLIGTPQWMAPEIMRREQYQEHSDVYSFGMIMWEIISKEIPYKNYSHPQIYGVVGFDENHKIEIPKRGIPRYLNLMQKCLIRDPSKRPTFQEIVDEVLHMKTDLIDRNKKQVVKEIIRFFD